MSPGILERMKWYILPGILICTSIAYFLQTAITTPNLLLSDFRRYKNRAFARLWLVIGPLFAQEISPSLNSILAGCKGTILEIGPGAGHTLWRYSRPKSISKIYGAEPGVDMHAELQENANKAGLKGKYKVLSCGAELESLVPALANDGLLGENNSLGDGVFDEIVSIRTLCSVPKPKDMVEGLYRCLKPGGRFIVYEHVVNTDEGIGWFLQHFYTVLGWSFWLDGCELTRDTELMLTQIAEGDGGWAEVSLKKVDGWSTLPHIAGYLVKKY